MVFYMVTRVAAGRAVTSVPPPGNCMRFVNRIAATLCAGLLLAGLPGIATAVAVDGLYEGTGTGDATDSGRAAAATDALRQVVVRLTGRRAAATDPALAPLYADARRMARTFRSAPGNQIVVAFDAEALEASLLQAGQRLWSRERPLTLVLLVSAKPGAPRSFGGAGEAELRRAVATAGQLRGLPLLWPTGLPASVEQVRVDDALAGRLEPLKELARQYGADALLVGRVTPAATSWAWTGPAGEGGVTGPGDEGVQALADRFGAQFASAGPRGGRIDAVVRGVHDLAGYALASNALAALANVHSVVLEEVSGDALHYRVSFDGDADALRRAARESGRFAPDDSAPPGGALQLVLRP
jgi:hypothetical protein